MEIYLCDDDSEITKQYSELIYNIGKKKKIKVNVVTFERGERVLNAIENAKEEPDLICLDIIMDGKNGISIAKKLRDNGYQTEIIFLTASKDYVFESFEIKPLAYLLKDEVSEKEFEIMFLKAADLSKKKEKENIVITAKLFRKTIVPEEIFFFEIVRKKIIINFRNREPLSYYSTMSDLESQVKSAGFIRIHRSYIVNLQYIKKLTRESVTLSNGIVLGMGVTYYEKLNKALMKYITENRELKPEEQRYYT